MCIQFLISTLNNKNKLMLSARLAGDKTVIAIILRHR